MDEAQQHQAPGETGFSEAEKLQEMVAAAEAPSEPIAETPPKYEIRTQPELVLTPEQAQAEQAERQELLGLVHDLQEKLVGGLDEIEGKRKLAVGMLDAYAQRVNQAINAASQLEEYVMAGGMSQLRGELTTLHNQFHADTERVLTDSRAQTPQLFESFTKDVQDLPPLHLAEALAPDRNGVDFNQRNIVTDPLAESTTRAMRGLQLIYDQVLTYTNMARRERLDRGQYSAPDLDALERDVEVLQSDASMALSESARAEGEYQQTSEDLFRGLDAQSTKYAQLIHAIRSQAAAS